MVSIAAASMLVACNDLDIQPEGSTITADQKQEVVTLDPSMAMAGVTGLASQMTAFGSITGGSASQDHWDIGFPGLYIMMDERGMDMYSVETGYNWFVSAMMMSDGLSTSQDAYTMWAYNYNLIFIANNVISSVEPKLEEGSEIPDDNEKFMFYVGQAYGFRAYAYWYLAQSFQFTYKGHENSPCVPIITNENSEEAAHDGIARSTVKEVYQQIINDLTHSLELLESTSVTIEDVIDSKPKRFLTPAAVHGMLARTYLLMNDWSKAAAEAQAAITKSGATPLTMEQASVPGFSSIEEDNWLWGIAVMETDRVVTTGICNFPSHMGSFCYGYATAVGAWKWINQKLYAKIPSSDVRKGWWLNSRGTSSNLTAQQQQYVSQRGADAGVQVKFAPYQGILNQDVNSCDIPLMRVEEMYYILAEAQGMQDLSTGIETLNDFVKTYRDPSYECLASSQEDFQDQVWLQRRIELWGEGMSYYDMMRLGKPLDRVGGGWPSTCEYYIEPTDPVLIYPIPASEITGNKQLTDADNVNAGGGRPTPVSAN